MYNRQYRNLMIQEPQIIPHNRDLRKQTNGFIPVMDLESNQIIGRVENFSQTGMCLLLNKSVKEADTLQFKIKVRDAQQNNLIIELSGKVKWIKQKTTNSFLCGLTVNSDNLKSKIRYKQWISG